MSTSSSKVTALLCVTIVLAASWVYAEEIRTELQTTRYSDWYQVTAHNSYQQYSDMATVLAKVSSVEYDVHPGIGWGVYHNIPDETKCTHSLNVCLKDIKKWHDNVIESGRHHAPVTVFIEIKEETGFKVKDFNGIFCGPSKGYFSDKDDAVFACSELYRPGDLLKKPDGSRYATLKEAANAKAWPTLTDLQDKIIFVVNGVSGALGKYMAETSLHTGDSNENRDEASVFVMVDDLTTGSAIDTLCNTSMTSEGQCKDKSKYYDDLHTQAKNIVFFNSECKTWNLIVLGIYVRSKNYISRGYTCDYQDDPSAAVISLARPLRLNFVAYDHIENAFAGVDYTKP